MPTLAEIVMEGGRQRADSIRRLAAIDAEGSQRNAAIWGNTIANIAGTATEAFTAHQKLKQDKELNAPYRAAQVAELESQTTARELAAKEKAEALARKKAIDNAMGSALTPDFDYDVDKLSANLSSIGMTDALKDLLPVVASTNEAMQKFRMSREEAQAGIAAGVFKAGNDPRVFENETARAREAGIISEKQAKALLAMPHATTDDVAKITTNLIAKSKYADMLKPIEANAPIFDPATGKFTVPPSVDKPVNLQKATFRLNGKDVEGAFDPETGKYFHNGQDVTAQAQKVPTAAAVNIQQLGNQPPAGPVSVDMPDPKTANVVDRRTGLTPLAMRQGAITFALRNTLPGGSVRDPIAMAARRGMQNQAAALADAANVNLAELQAEYKQVSGAGLEMLKAYQANTAAAEAANSNIELVREYAKGVDRSNMPAANKVSQALTNFFGGKELPPLTKLEAAIFGAAREYAKVTSGNRSASGLTDSATRQAELLLNAAMAPGQLDAAIEVMQRDMAQQTAPQLNKLQNQFNRPEMQNLLRFTEFLGRQAGLSGGSDNKDPMGIRR